MKEYVKLAIEWDNNYQNSKYVLTRMINEREDNDLMNRTRKCRSAQDVAKLFDLEQYYLEKAQERRDRKESRKNVIGVGSVDTWEQCVSKAKDETDGEDEKMSESSRKRDLENEAEGDGSKRRKVGEGSVE